MPSTQCFACLSSLPTELTSKRTVSSTLNKFQLEIKDLMRIFGGTHNNCKDINKSREQLLDNVSVCSKCLNPINLVVSSKSKVDRVESTVRKLQMDLLKQLNKLEKCLEGLWGDMEVIGGIIQNSVSDHDGERQISTDNGLTEDVRIFRNDILDVKRQLERFRTGNRTLNPPSFSISQKNLQNSSDIPPQISVKIKTEPETNNLNLNNFDEDPADLNIMECDDDPFDSPPSDTSTPINQNNSPDSPKSPPKTPRKYYKVPNKCTKCSKTFTLKFDLQTHQKMYHPPNINPLQAPVSCPHCQETMSSPVLLRTHKLYHCPSLKKNKPPMFPCTICKKTFQNVEDLKDHNLKNHKKKLKYMCETCGKISVSSQAKEMHQNTHKDPRNREVVECEDCGKMILTTSISSHKRLGCPKRENSSFLCKICRKFYSNASSLKRHVRVMHKGHKMDKDDYENKRMGYRRNIKVIAEEDNHEDEEDKPTDVDENDNSDSEYIPSEGDEDNKQINRKSRHGAPLKCPKCPRTFTWTRALKKHKITHHKNDWLSEQAQCSHCLETIPRKILRTHLLYHCPLKSSKDTIYSCTLCKPSLEAQDTYQQPIFPDIQTLKCHVANKHPKKMLNLICDICGLISGSIQSHLRHQVRHVNPKDREFVECEACGKSMLSTSLSSHKRFGCPKRERTKFPCIYCTKLFSTEMSVVRHVNRWHTGENGELLLKARRPKQLQCHLCGVWIQDKGQMRRHLRSRHQSWEEREDKVVCQFCGKEMLGVSLGQHERYYCGGKEREGEGVTCEICGKGFKSGGLLQGHKKVVHGGGRFVCELCGKVFGAKRNYKWHLERHKGIRRFECELGCGARFKQKSHLKRHLGLRYCLGEKGPRKQRRNDLEVGMK